MWIDVIETLQIISFVVFCHFFKLNEWSLCKYFVFLKSDQTEKIEVRAMVGQKVIYVWSVQIIVQFFSGGFYQFFFR